MECKNLTKMTKRKARAWIKALRSGEYKQGRGTLSADSHFCCLGVYGAINGVPEEDLIGRGLLPPHVLPQTTQSRLAGMNDGIGAFQMTFKEIADHIEKHILPRRPDRVS